MDARRVLDDGEADLEIVAVDTSIGPGRWSFSTLLALCLVLIFLVLRMSGGGAGPDIAAPLRSGGSPIDGPPAVEEHRVASPTDAVAAPITTSPKQDPQRSTAPPAAVWPFVDRGLRFDDPVAVAVGFAETYLGFARPLGGVYRPIDDDYGEVEIRAVAGGPVTLVLVDRSAADQTWWVMGASAPDITLHNPTPRSTIGDPLYLSGEALSAGGSVRAELRASGSLAPIVQLDFVTAGGLQPDWFEGMVGWTGPGPDMGTVVVVIHDPDQHEIVAATAVPVNLP